MDDDPQSGRGSVEVDPALPSVALSCRILHEIEQHARDTYPEECCGLISGDDRVRFRSLHRCRNEMTKLHEADPDKHPCDGRFAFQINPGEYLRVEAEVHARGERITAVVHSHVGARAYFSSVDLAFATRPDFPFDDADHIVVAVVDGIVQKEERALFRRSAVGNRFQGHPIVEVPT